MTSGDRVVMAGGRIETSQYLTYCQTRGLRMTTGDVLGLVYSYVYAFALSILIEAIRRWRNYPRTSRAKSSTLEQACGYGASCYSSITGNSPSYQRRLSFFSTLFSCASVSLVRWTLVRAGLPVPSISPYPVPSYCLCFMKVGSRAFHAASNNTRWSVSWR